MCVNDKQVTIPESSNMQVMEPVASHIDETTNEDMLEEPVMIPGHSHAMVQIVESVEGLGRIPVIVERPIMETEEILGGCETNRIPAEVEVEELATDLATVPVEVQGQAEATILATVSSTVQVEEQATVLATVDNPLEVNIEVIENQDSLIEADIQISENLMDVQVEFPDEIQDNLEEEHVLSTKRRKLVISETSETNDDDLNMEVPTEEEGQMQLVTVPIQQKQAEFEKGILDLKKDLSSGNNEDEDTRLSSPFLKVDECQEEISTKFAKVIELKEDIREAHENIFKQLTSLNDQQKDITKELKYSAEKSEKKWDEKTSKLITNLHNELSSLRRENAATSAKVNNIEAKATKIDGNVDLLVDYAKKGEESSHLALSPSFAHIESSMGRGRGRGRGRSSGVSGFSQFAANQNRILEEELKKGPEVPRRKMIYLSDEVNMMKELINYTGHEGKHLDGGRSFSECIKWFREGVLSGDSIQEAYGNYLSGQVQAKYKNAKFEENFRDLRDHINRRIEEEAKGKKKSSFW
nr:uncharacterized protein LOC109181202 [Ipomoea batatas]